MRFTIGDGSTGIHWRQMDDDTFYLDFRLTPKKHAIGEDAEHLKADPDLSIKVTNPRSLGVLIWACSEILQRMGEETKP